MREQMATPIFAYLLRRACTMRKMKLAAHDGMDIFCRHDDEEISRGLDGRPLLRTIFAIYHRAISRLLEQHAQATRCVTSSWPSPRHYISLRRSMLNMRDNRFLVDTAPPIRWCAPAMPSWCRHTRRGERPSAPQSKSFTVIAQKRS